MGTEIIAATCHNCESCFCQLPTLTENRATGYKFWHPRVMMVLDGEEVAYESGEFTTIEGCPVRLNQISEVAYVGDNWRSLAELWANEFKIGVIGLGSIMGGELVDTTRTAFEPGPQEIIDGTCRIVPQQKQLED